MVPVVPGQVDPARHVERFPPVAEVGMEDIVVIIQALPVDCIAVTV